MKYSQMSPAQQAALQGIITAILTIKSQEEQQYTQAGYRLLVLANGAGIAILAAFMGSVAGSGGDFSHLLAPLTKFLIGAILAALTYVPLIAVANQATLQIGNQIMEFLLDKKDLEQFQGYGFSSKGKWVLAVFMVGSFVFFCVGVSQCISVLTGIRQ